LATWGRRRLVLRSLWQFVDGALELGDGNGALGEQAAQRVEFRLREQGLQPA
jgi:hypothetical protein